MGRRRSEKRHGKFVPQAGHPHHHIPDPIARLICTHPTQSSLVALAVGPCVRILDCSNSSQVSEQQLLTGGLQGNPTAAIRLVQFSPDGRMLLTASDDRVVRLWETDGWQCVSSWISPKKTSAGAFTRDSRHVIWGDKYGDVLIGDCSKRNLEAQPQQPALLMGHLCSVVASISVSPDNRYVVSCDKDRKVRVSILPDQPMLGSVEIQSYCLGHTYFVSSCAWVTPMKQGGMPLLLTGSGDGTARLWDADSGRLLDTCVLSEVQPEEADRAEGALSEAAATASGAVAEAEPVAMVEEAEEEAEDMDADGQEGPAEYAAAAAEEGEDEDGEDRVAMGPKCAPVTCLASSKDGLLVAALVEGRDEVLLMRVDPTTQKLAIVHELALPGVRFPCHAAFDSKDRLWVVGGPPLDTSRSAHVGVARLTDAGELSACTSEALSPELLEALEQRNEDEEKQLLAGSLVPAYTKRLMTYRKRWFTPELQEQAKRLRRDFRETERLRNLVQQEGLAVAGGEAKE